jgi:hypothetical protein
MFIWEKDEKEIEGKLYQWTHVINEYGLEMNIDRW